MLQSLLITSFLLGNIYKYSLFFTESRVSFLDISVGLIFLIILIKKSQFIAPKPVIGFIIICLISLLISGSRYGLSAMMVGFFYIIRWSAYNLLPVAIPSLKSSSILFFLGLITVVTSVVQYIFSPDIRNLAVAEWDPHYYRVVGSLLDPGYTGLMLVFFLIFLTLSPQIVKTKKIILWGITYLAFVFTYSRSSYLAYLVAMAYISLRGRGWRFFVGTSLLLFATLPLLPRSSDGEGVKLERTSSVQARIENWRQSWAIFVGHPILGVGFNTYRYAQKSYGFFYNEGNLWLRSHAGAGADSSLLFVLATTGVVGFVFYLKYLKYLYQFSTLRYYLVPLFFHSFFLNSLFYPFVLVWIALVIIKERTSP